MLLRAHFDRTYGEATGAQHLAQFMSVLKERQMAVSFEMVTGERSSSFHTIPGATLCMCVLQGRAK